MTPEQRHLKLIVTIVERGKEQKIAAMYRKHGVAYHFSILGKGTAKNELLDHLGIGETEKAVLFSLAEEERLPSLWHHLNQDFHFDKPGHGIAFTIPLASIGGEITLNYVLGLIGKEQTNEK